MNKPDKISIAYFFNSAEHLFPHLRCFTPKPSLAKCKVSVLRKRCPILYSPKTHTRYVIGIKEPCGHGLCKAEGTMRTTR